jgi:hypothetical protein
MKEELEFIGIFLKIISIKNKKIQLMSNSSIHLSLTLEDIGIFSVVSININITGCLTLFTHCEDIG